MAATDTAIVAYGPTQVGKSSVVGTLVSTHQPPPTVGNGSGESVTEYCQVLDTKVGSLVDTPGIGDTRFRFSNEEAGRRIALALSSTVEVNKVKFIIVESLVSDSIQLRQTLASLIEAFGDNVRQHTMVLATKHDAAAALGVADARLATVKQVAGDLGLCGVTHWQSKDLSDETMATQLALLQEQLANVQATPIQALSDLRSRTDEMAETLCANHPTQTRTVEVDVDEEYQVPYQEQEAYSEPFTEMQDFEEKYPDVKSVEVTKEITVPVTVKHKGIGGKFGLTKTKEVTRSVTVTESRPVTRTRTVQRPVAKTRTAYRTVTKYRKATRKVQKQKIVGYRLPKEHFLGQAREAIVEEIRADLRG